MIDDYPGMFRPFILKREKAKRARIEADRLEKESDDEMKRMFKLYDREPLYDVADLEKE